MDRILLFFVITVAGRGFQVVGSIPAEGSSTQVDLTTEQDGEPTVSNLDLLIDIINGSSSTLTDGEKAVEDATNLIRTTMEGKEPTTENTFGVNNAHEKTTLEINKSTISTTEQDHSNVPEENISTPKTSAVEISNTPIKFYVEASSNLSTRNPLQKINTPESSAAEINDPLSLSTGTTHAPTLDEVSTQRVLETSNTPIRFPLDRANIPPTRNSMDNTNTQEASVAKISYNLEKHPVETTSVPAGNSKGSIPGASGLLSANAPLKFSVESFNSPTKSATENTQNQGSSSVEPTYIPLRFTVETTNTPARTTLDNKSTPEINTVEMSHTPIRFSVETPVENLQALESNNVEINNNPVRFTVGTTKTSLYDISTPGKTSGASTVDMSSTERRPSVDMTDYQTRVSTAKPVYVSNIPPRPSSVPSSYQYASPLDPTKEVPAVKHTTQAKPIAIAEESTTPRPYTSRIPTTSYKSRSSVGPTSTVSTICSAGVDPVSSATVKPAINPDAYASNAGLGIESSDPESDKVTATTSRPVTTVPGHHITHPVRSAPAHRPVRVAATQRPVTVAVTRKPASRIDNLPVTTKRTVSLPSTSSSLQNKVPDLRKKGGIKIKKHKKKDNGMSSLIYIPLMIQAQLMPMMLMNLKFLALKALTIGKLALLILGLNLLRNAMLGYNNDAEQYEAESIASQHYGYTGSPEYGSWVNRRMYRKDFSQLRPTAQSKTPARSSDLGGVSSGPSTAVFPESGRHPYRAYVSRAHRKPVLVNDQ